MESLTLNAETLRALGAEAPAAEEETSICWNTCVVSCALTEPPPSCECPPVTNHQAQ